MRSPARLFIALSIGGAILAEDKASDIGKLTEQLRASDAPTRRTAAYRLAQLGPEAKAALPGLITALGDSDKQVWSSAVGAIAEFGPAAAEAIPALIDGLDSRKARNSNPRGRNQVVMRSAYALAQIGAPAIPPLIQALGGDDTPLRIGAAKALGGMGPAAKDAIPALITNFGHEDAELRREVIEALAAIGAEAKPKIIDALSWNEPLQRGTAALALAEIGKAAGDATPALTDRLSTETDPMARASLLTALTKVGVEPARLAPLLIDGLKDDREPIRRAAINGLLTVRPASARPTLLAMLRDPATSERAAYVLSRMGEKDAAAAIVEAALKQQPPSPAFLDALVQIGEPAMPEILRAVEKENPEVLTSAHWSVKCLSAMGGLAAPGLAHGVASPSLSVRLVAVRALSALGPDAEIAAPELLKALADPDARVRAQSLAALAAAKTDPKTLTPRIEAALKDNSAEMRLAGLAAWGGGERDAAQKIPPFAAALDDSDERVRRAAAAGLAALGEKATDTALKFLPMLRRDGERGFALEALRQLRVRSVPALIEMLGVPDASVQLFACERLASLGSAARDAISALQALPADAPENVRTAAQRALEKIGSGN